jgi:cytoskeletal protein CcmA (bactofilin family)
MLTKQSQTEALEADTARSPTLPTAGVGATPTVRPSGPAARNLACLGPGLEIKGTIMGTEDLQIDGRVEGLVSLEGHSLTVGASARLTSDITARQVTVYGSVTGNLQARDRVDIKKDGSVVGDITTVRISIEDGAHFKGRIEIDPTKLGGHGMN